MDLSTALSLGGAVGTIICGALATVYSKRADNQTKATGNGFARHVLTALDDIIIRLERLENRDARQ